jgi:hypothetical protein
MTVIPHIVLRGVSSEEYDRVRAETGWIERPPDGGISHVTWWEGDDCHNIDDWEREEAFAKFGIALDQQWPQSVVGKGSRSDLPLRVSRVMLN